MRAFARLYGELDATTKTGRKLAALRAYFEQAEPADAAWTVAFLCGRRLKRLLPSKLLRAWGAAAAGVPDWLFEESYQAVGDLAETLALLLPPAPVAAPRPLHEYIEAELLNFPSFQEHEQRQVLLHAWQEMDRTQRLVYNKVLTGEFRVGVSRQLVIRALAEASGQGPAAIAHRLMGDWAPSAAFYLQLISPDSLQEEISRPYPFLLAHSLMDDPATLGDPADWLIEWKWDGIRAQLLRRRGETFLWSRGEELVTERYPEVVARALRLPEGTVLDGELLAWKDGKVLPFGALQRRIGRKDLNRKILAEVPAVFLAFDLLEWAGQDIRASPLSERRAKLEELWKTQGMTEPLVLSEPLRPRDWADLATLREESRARDVEGMMLKARSSPYATGRPRGLWWKWKVDPYRVDAVMIYAQLGHGRRASLYTDYTFAVWHEGQLVPFAKAYSGLNDEEIGELDRWIRQHTLERHGPVRQVEPMQVFEIAFEGIQKSARHRSGVAVRFPRIARWRRDKNPQEADTLASVLGMIKEEPAPRFQPGKLFD